MDKQERNWHPISMLPVFSEMIDGMLENAINQLEIIYPVLDKPHVLDDHTVNRVIKLYSKQLGDLWLIDTQLARWKEDGLTETQAMEVDRLIKQMPELKMNEEKVLKLIQSIEHNTIDKIMDMDELEVLDSILSGKIKPPR